MCELLAAGCCRDHRRRCHRAGSEPPCRLSRHPGARTSSRLVLPLSALCGSLPPNASRRCATPGSMAGSPHRRGCTTHYALVAERDAVPAAGARGELSGDLCRPPHPRVNGQAVATASWMAHDRCCPCSLTAHCLTIAPDTPLLTSPFMQLSSMITYEVMLPVPEPVMPCYDVLWNYEDEDGNLAHITEDVLTPEDVNAVLMDSDETGV